MVKKLIHRSPLGTIDINGVGPSIPPGIPFDAPDDVAETLLQQTDLFQIAPSSKETSK